MDDWKIYHAIFTMICLFREIYDSKVSRIGNFMRLNEIFCMFINMGLTVRTISAYVDADSLTRATERGIVIPTCAADIKLMQEWAGNAPAWFCIESSIFIFYIVSMIILMVKSRFIQVGID